MHTQHTQGLAGLAVVQEQVLLQLFAWARPQQLGPGLQPKVSSVP